MSATKDRLNYWTWFGHNGLQQLTSITNALTNATQLSWCDCGALSSTTDALTNTTSLFYNNQGLLTNIVFADNSSLKYYRDSIGRVATVMDGLNRALSIGYNNQGLVTTVSNNYGRLERIVYDATDRAIETTDANDVTVTNSFDLLNRLLARSYPSGGGIEGFLWSTNGLLAYTNQDQHVTWFNRDGAGRVLGVTNANLEITRFAYNALSQITDLWDGRTNHTGWRFNEFGWLMGKTNALGQEVLRLLRDPNGQITNRWTPEFGASTYILDPVGNLLTNQHGLSSISYSYDKINQLRTMIDVVGATVFDYTRTGQLKSEDGPWSSDTVTYGYSEGLRSSLSLLAPQGNPFTNSYAYDSAWRLQTLTSSSGTFGYQYPSSVFTHRASRITLPNFASITNHVDTLGRLDFTALVDYWGHLLDGYSYTHDPLGLRTNIVRDFGLTTNSVTVGYDAIEQITSWSGKESSGYLRLNEQYGFGFDSAHNLRSRTNGALIQTFNSDAINELTNVTRIGTLTVSGTTPAPATNITVNGSAAERYGDFTFARTNVSLFDGQNTFTNIARNTYGTNVTNTLTLSLSASNMLAFDRNGNLTNDGTRSFFFDAENQLTNVTVSGSWKIQFVYDGLGRRRIIREYGWNGDWVKTNETRVIYDGLLPIQERDTNNAALLTYTRGSDLSGSLQGAGGIGGLLARTDTNGSTFYHSDGAGNVTALIDGYQNVVARYLYSPFGRLNGIWGPLAGANKMRHSSMPSFDGAGVIGYPFRFYDPALQRFISQDPIGERGGINLYGFVHNNPLRYIDPFGLDIIDDYIESQNARAVDRYTVDYALGEGTYDAGRQQLQDVIDGIHWVNDFTGVNQIAKGMEEASEGNHLAALKDTGLGVLAMGTMLTPLGEEKGAAEAGGGLLKWFKGLWKKCTKRGPGATKAAKNLEDLLKEKAALEKALWETRQQLDNGRNLAARLRNAGLEVNPHGLGKEINEILPAEITRIEQRLAEIGKALGPPK